MDATDQNLPEAPSSFQSDLDQDHNHNTSTSMDAPGHDQNLPEVPSSSQPSQDLDLDHDHDHTRSNEPDDSELDLDHSEDGDHSDYDGDLDQDGDDNDNNGENMLNSETDQPLYCTDNNPPESFSVCQAKVADWLNHHTYIERKTSVKFAITKSLDPTQTQTRSSNRTISLNQRPKLSIIGFRKKPIHQTEGRSKHNEKAENIKLFRNRSEPGRDYCLLITEPVSPRVSCVGRVGSVRVHGKKAGVWRSFKAAFSNLVHTSRVTKMAA